jgi:acetoin:2,6-dichlorophenolindophenol oxidoreductase subunit alpha
VSGDGGGNLARLFFDMARIREFELAIARLWQRGLISGELHLGLGEEGVVAGVVGRLEDGDALAVDHRSTPPLVACGVDLASLVLELAGSEDGLCRGMGGHMHLFAPDRLAASSGIVGAAGPLACGFALAAVHLRPGRVAVAFFGEGAANQGMLMESLNLAAVWRLPVVFVCKDNGWAITTRSRTVTGGDLRRRAASFDMPSAGVDGTDVQAVWRAAGRAVRRALRGRGPSFLLVRCRHLEGHFLGDRLLRSVREPAQGRELAGPLRAALRARPGASVRDRARGLAALLRPVAVMAADDRLRRCDPVASARRALPREAADRIETEAAAEVTAAVNKALAMIGVTP